MTTPRTVPKVYETEAGFMRTVIEYAQLMGWHVYHPQLSKWSEPGYPDLTMLRPPRMVVAELKTDRKASKLTPAQQRWLDEFRQCRGIEVHVWRPSNWDLIEIVLR